MTITDPTTAALMAHMDKMLTQQRERAAVANLRAHLQDDHSTCVDCCAMPEAPAVIEHKTRTWEVRELIVHPRTTRLVNRVQSAGWRCTCGAERYAHDRRLAQQAARHHRDEAAA